MATALVAAVLFPLAGIVLLDGIRSSAAEAEYQTALAANAGRRLSAQPTVPSAEVDRVLAAVGAQQLTGMSLRLTTARDARSFPITGIMTQSEALADDYGVTLDARTGERVGPGLAVSRAAATALDLALGQDVQVLIPDQEPRPMTVFRIFTLPSSPDTQLVVLAAARADMPSSTRWVMTDEQADDERLAGLMTNGDHQLRLTSARSQADEQVAALDYGQLAPLRSVAPFGVGCVVALWSAVVFAAHRRWAAHVDALQRVGLNRRDALRVPHTAFAGLAVVGLAGGLLLGTALLHLLAGHLGRVVDHDWVSASQSWLRLGSVILVLPALLALSVWWICAPPTWSRRLRGRSREVLFAGSVATVLGALLLASTVVDHESADVTMRTLVAGVLITVGGPSLAWWVVHRRHAGGLPPVTRLAAQHGLTLIAPAMVLGAIAFSTSALSLYGSHQVRFGTEGHLDTVAPGAMALLDVNEQDAATLARLWSAEAGAGDEVDLVAPLTFAVLDESDQMLRVSTPEFTDCMEEYIGADLDVGEAQCSLPTDVMSPLNWAVQHLPETDPAARALSVDTVYAQPEIIQNGQVGILKLDLQGRVQEASTLPATGLDVLGGLAPGVVLPEEIANEPRSLLRALLITDLLSTDRQTQAHVIGSAGAVTPTSPLLLGTGYADGGITGFSVLMAGVGALLGAAVVLTGLLTLSGSAARDLALVNRWGTPAKRRRVAALLAMTFACPVLLGFTAAYLATAVWGTEGSMWWNWLPLMVGAIGAVLIARRVLLTRS